MPVTLEEIVAARRQDVAQAKAAADMAELRRRAEAHRPRGFRRALIEASQTRPAIIAELKKASPSRGVLRGSFPVARLAAGLAAAGAAALSVLTEERHFQGSLANLREASAATDLPCLRKDFILDEFQLLEARAHHADAVLLISAVLTWAELRALHAQARELSLDALVEVHDEAELGRARAIGADLIGVNSRDLRTFRVDLETAHQLAPKTPNNALLVAESGIKSADDMRKLRAAGYSAFLIGESLMQAEDPGEALRLLLAEAKALPLGAARVSGWGDRDEGLR
jgi:indole-3-glycerol phosphate synthase